MVPKSESFQIYLEISTPVHLEALSTSLTLIFQILYLKSIFMQIGRRFKTLPDLFENFPSTNLEGAECRCNMSSYI